ncbi:uncharacterized protein [Rutidosis leptorrhynchoides]|uniref:uncharacterized protein n=1 Tax=Rutidosis leptorrhynchoides TaxID=125765 RepID=UPI003A993503
MAGRIADTLGTNFTKSFIKSIGNGTDTKFWQDTWCGTEKFSNQFRRLYMLESNKHALVADRITTQNSTTIGLWNWSRNPHGRTLNELTELNNLLSTIKLTDKPDTWIWSLDKDGMFTTKKLASILDNTKLATPQHTFKTPKNKFLPQKINIFIWRLIYGRIPTRSELDKRNIDLNSLLYPLCNSHIETIEHILCHCPKTSSVWLSILNWWNHPSNTITTINDVTISEQLFTTTKIGSYIWQATKWASSYILWKHRNLNVFSKKEWCVASILTEIQAQTYAWISKRSKNSTIDWHQWLTNPSSYTSNQQRSDIG